MLLRTVLLIVLVTGSMAAAAADVYKWTDAAGVVHYSDTEPAAQVNAQKLHLFGAATSEVAPGATGGANAAEESGEDAAAKTKLPGTLASAVQSAEKRCDQARTNLELLQSKFTVGLDSGGTGKAEVLDDQARQAQIAAAQTLIATYCK